jgi:hypothetical protein
MKNIELNKNSKKALYVLKKIEKLVHIKLCGTSFKKKFKKKKGFTKKV